MLASKTKLHESELHSALVWDDSTIITAHEVAPEHKAS
ncbi:hypothetical protein PPHE_a1017 [Pseudoalteromonas phenolica O-BC30]|nr:hypothetical protein [Pseudoalteromonas phenolica O-BC30]